MGSINIKKLKPREVTIRKQNPTHVIFNEGRKKIPISVIVKLESQQLRTKVNTNTCLVIHFLKRNSTYKRDLLRKRSCDPIL